MVSNVKETNGCKEEIIINNALLITIVIALMPCICTSIITDREGFCENKVFVYSFGIF